MEKIKNFVISGTIGILILFIYYIFLIFNSNNLGSVGLVLLWLPLYLFGGLVDNILLSLIVGIIVVFIGFGLCGVGVKMAFDKFK